METLDERSYTFVVRIWAEPRDLAGAVPAWRGSVDDIQTGARLYFGTLGELSDYLRRQSGMTAIALLPGAP
jgi:hypothetical protein